jgi:beta-1,4-mannosyltransferase
MSPASVGANDNPFIRMFVGEFESRPRVAIRPFTWRRALVGRYDVLHVHWPERLVRHHRRWFEILRACALSALLLRCVLRRVAIVQTVHNLSPHERGTRVERLALALLERVTTTRVLLTAADTDRSSAASVHIPHGDYAPHVAKYARSVAESRRGLLLFGYLRPYKNIERLIGCVAGRPDLALEILGSANDREFGTKLEQLAATARNVSVDIALHDDAELIAHIDASEAVVLPYRNMYNSGAAILALTLRCPLILSASDATRQLRDETGPSWIELLPEEWGADDLAAAVAHLRMTAADRAHGAPLSVNRAWASVATEYESVYARAVSSVRTTSPSARFRSGPR